MNDTDSGLVGFTGIRNTQVRVARSFNVEP